MANKPETLRISVAMATYNGAPYLAEQLDSILDQSMLPEEIIVCDDGSTDSTQDILNRYAAKGMLRFFQNDRSLGIAQNFRRAVSLCKGGNYIAFADQDDVWLPEKLQAGYDVLLAIDDRKTPAISFHDLTLVDESLAQLQPSFWDVLNVAPAHETFHSMLFGNIITGCTVMMNDAMRQRFCSLPADPRAGMHDAWLGLIAYGLGRHAAVQERLILYRQHGRNATFDTNRKKSPMDRIKQAGQQLAANRDYLKKELAQAELFRESFSNELPAEMLTMLDEFLALRSASFWRKKYSSILARRYRLSKTKT